MLKSGAKAWSGSKPVHIQVQQNLEYEVNQTSLENPMDGGAWQATVQGVARSRTRLSDFTSPHLTSDFPGGSDGKASAYNAGDQGSIPGSGRSPGEGNGNPLQYSGLENPMDGGAWQATVHGATKSQIRLSDFTFTFQE